MSDPIIIEDYDPHWPEQFELLGWRIGTALGPLASAIEHVGSTAVPGLAAKPILDIDVLLHSATDLPEAVRHLGTLGYEHRGDLGVPGREAFRRPDDIPHHLYVLTPESREYIRHITFRNHLRANPQDARAYERLKRALAQEYRDNRELYNQAKTQFVEAILRKANAREHSPAARRIISWMRRSHVFTFLLWCILFILCWPLALLALVAYPFIWLLLLPFRIVGVAVHGVLEVIYLAITLPFRLLAAPFRI
jgi:GrpB-like predicted nucleotidyltransferase (UPF0157 family)